MIPSRYLRQSRLKVIGAEAQFRIEQSRIAIVGLGALGSVSADLLARAGVGILKLIDRDFVELQNLQRQVLYTEKDAVENLPKAVAAAAHLKSINSEIKIQPEVTDLNAETIANLLSDVDLVVDGLDNFETRFLINDFCLKNQKPWIYGGVVGTEGMSYVVQPPQRPCLRCLFKEAPAPQQAETCETSGVLASAAHLIASLQVTEALKIVSGNFGSVDPKLWKVDLWTRQFKSFWPEDLETVRCSGCLQQEYPYLLRQRGAYASVLCGRNAVQLYQKQPANLDFKKLADKLATEGDVRFNEYLLKCCLGNYEITVFPNGRAIIQGTEDEAQARSLYQRCVGS